ncbi:MAG: pyrroline-5-carboxylate reductase [Campylobacter sp.]|nr:pyrroline-5-carboxylate reductase [Campylobacter sp.]
MEVYILGSGAMATAIANGIKDKFKVTIIGRDEAKLQSFKIQGFEIGTYSESFDITDKNIILAFKPYALASIGLKLKGEANCLISILARTYLEDLDGIAAREKLCCMPNIAASYKASLTPYIATSKRETALKIISEFGRVFDAGDKNSFNVAGVLSGCAPAYLALVAEALANAGVKAGLRNDLSSDIVNGLFFSMDRLLTHSHPALLKERVCSPGGTTIKGIAALEECGVRSAFFKAVEASSKGE